MRKLLILTAAILLSLKVANADEAAEPPLRLTLTVNGQTLTAGEGKPVQLKGAFNDPTISVNVDPYRAFSAQGVSFEYPRGFSFEADFSDQNAKIWTLAGNDLKIMLFVIAAKTDDRAIADGMADQFGRDNVTESATELTLGGKKIPGVRQLISLMGHKLTNDVFVLSTAANRTVVLVLQDSPQPNGDRSTEGQAGIARLSETYRLAE